MVSSAMAGVAAVRSPEGIQETLPAPRDLQRDVPIVLGSFSEALAFASRPKDAAQPGLGVPVATPFA